jgi:hypothetical protein
MPIAKREITDVTCDKPGCGYSVAVTGDVAAAEAEIGKAVAAGRWEERDGVGLVCVICLAIEGKWGAEAQANAARIRMRITGQRVELPPLPQE